MIALAHRPRPLRILVIEEDPVQRKLMQACLEVLQADMLVAPRAANGIWLFRRHPVDMVIMDLDWHAAEEIEAFEEMRRPSRWGRRVPIIAVTDNECCWTESQYRGAGFAALFLKPVDPMRLFGLLDDVLRDEHMPPLLDHPIGLHHGPVLHNFA
jgi:CheY-like chemotaxis protein